jgi:DNA processing protein
MSQQKTASWLLQHPDAMETVITGRFTNVDSSDFIIQEQEDLDEERMSVLHPLSSEFPHRVRELKDFVSLPAILYIRGNAALLRRPGVAIVGARNAGDLALKAASELASELGRKGINVTSGYAKGIDTAAHLGALRDGGTTSIVLSEGINHFRPKRELREFFSQENTLVISQFAPYARWASHFAMTRNKLVCALSHAVVVIVSGPERDSDGRMSGTFDAGATALQMGIPVFTVLPSFFPFEPEGNRQLISRGCLTWNPSDGAEPIISGVKKSFPLDSEKSVPKRKKDMPKQLDLFRDQK